MIDRDSKKNTGFTLVEILVAVAIFGFMAAMLAGIYLAFSDSQNRARASQQLLNDTQYALEIMAREIRADQIIDYDPDCASILGANYPTCILLSREDGQMIAFARGLTDGDLVYITPDCTSTPGTCNWQGTYRDITSLLYTGLNNIRTTTDTKFVIVPALDPYEVSATAPNTQPRVTIFLGATFNSQKDYEQVTHNLQTTVSSRIYKR